MDEINTFSHLRHSRIFSVPDSNRDYQKNTPFYLNPRMFEKSKSLAIKSFPALQAIQTFDTWKTK